MRVTVDTFERCIRVSVYPKHRALLDTLLVPVMRWLQADGALQTQMTHRWNNYHGTPEEFSWLDPTQMVSVPADSAARSVSMVAAHMPRFGGWRNVVLLEPLVPVRVWYVGWFSEPLVGFSYLPVEFQVRMLRGPASVLFFGIDVDTGLQIPIRLVKYSQIGDRLLQFVPLR